MLRGLTTGAAGGAGWLVVRGPSGAGKSTFLAVLLAALRPRAGRYAQSGVDTARLTGGAVRARTAWLPQDAHVFASTMRANLALAAPKGALPGEARMTAALTAAGLGPLLAGLPAGLDTRSAPAAWRCPAASGAGWPWPARCWPTGTWSCSTSRPRTSTRRPRPRWYATCAPRWPAGSSSASPTTTPSSGPATPWSG